MAARPVILGAVLRIFHGEVFRFQRMQAKAHGHAAVKTGAVLGLQRFGGSLNLHCHVHALFFDGVFIDKDFMPLPALTLSDLENIAERVMKRTLRFLKKRGLLRDAGEASDATPTALESCQRLAMTLGRFARLTEAGLAERVSRAKRLFDAPKTGPRKLAADVVGFNIKAGVMVPAGDREGLERLCRYILRPTLSLRRMSITRDGLIAYRPKYAGKGAKHLALTPLEFLRRVAALIASPRLIRLRYAGILALHATDRKRAAPLAVRTGRASVGAFEGCVLKVDVRRGRATIDKKYYRRALYKRPTGSESHRIEARVCSELGLKESAFVGLLFGRVDFACRASKRCLGEGEQR